MTGISWQIVKKYTALIYIYHWSPRIYFFLVPDQVEVQNGLNSYLEPLYMTKSFKVDWLSIFTDLM